MNWGTTQKPSVSRVLRAVAGATALAAAPAQSQSDAEPVVGLEEIVVTAQKRAENLQEVPIAVSAFSAAMLETQYQRDIGDLTGRVPSLMISPSPSGPGAANVSLRGIFFQEIEKSFEPGVGVVLDGVYLSTSTGQLLQSFDFEQIEVLRGPQGTLFGKNTTGGALNVTRTRPDPAGGFKGKVRGTVGSFGRTDLEAVVSIPLIADRLAVKIGAFSLNDSGSWKNITLDEKVVEKDYQALTVALRATPNSDLDLQLTYDHVDDDSDLPGLISRFSPALRATGSPGLFNGADRPCFNDFMPGICDRSTPRNETRQNFRGQASYDLDAITFNGRYDFGSMVLAAVSGYRDSTEWALNDGDAIEYDLFRTWRPQKFHQFSQEVRIESDLEGPLSFVAGVYYFKSNYELRQSTYLDLAALQNIPPGTLISRSSYGVEQDYESTALFLQGDYRLTDALTLTLGGRYTWDDKKIRFDNYAASTTFPSTGALTASTTRDAKWDEFTPRVALRYAFNPDLSMYASYSRGYNTGGFNGRAASAALLGPYDPEIVKSVEVGVKSELFERRLRVNAAVYENRFSDKQEEVIVAIPVAPFTGTTVSNAAKARYRGAELEFTAVPLDGLTVSGSVGYLKAKYLDFFASLRPGTPAVDNSGLTLRRAPEWTASGSIDYQFPLGIGEAGVNGSIRHISAFEMQAINDPLGHQPAHTLVDAALRYSWIMGDVDLTATVFGKNLTNTTPNTVYTTAGINSFVSYVGEALRRQWGFELQAKF